MYKYVNVYSFSAMVELVPSVQITDADGNLERLYLSPAHKHAAHKVMAESESCTVLCC